MPNSPTFLSACRQCGGTHLTPAFTLGTDNAWVICGDGNGDAGCGLVQRATLNHETAVMPVEHMGWTEQYRLRSVVASALEMVSTREGRALDIDCGDGVLLGAYPRWITPVGVDPRLSESGRADFGVAVGAPFLDDDTQDALGHIAQQGFDVITAIGCLDHYDEPRAFLHNVKALLAEDGVFVLETPYLALALTRTLTSTFHAGANTAFSLSSVDALARAAGMQIVRGMMTEAAAGSIRLFMTHADYRGHDYAPWLDQLAGLWDAESALNLQSRAAYHAFSMRVQARARDIATLKAQMLRADEHAYVVGTCPRTFAMLAGGDLDYDVISAHVGADAREGFPEVVTTETARAAPPDVLIVPAWRRRESLELWHDQVMAGMRLCFVEPDLTLVDSHNYALELGRALALTDGPGSVETLRAALAAMRGPGLRLVRRGGEA